MTTTEMQARIGAIEDMLAKDEQQAVIAMHKDVMTHDKLNKRTPLMEAYLVALPPSVMKKLLRQTS